jgi:4-amino-4-deoxy-L-arabinose transferase-like glycosyltransferase
VFWLGFSIGGQRAAMLASLICTAHPAFIYHAHIAAPAIYHTGFAALSIAAALWAIRPLKPPPSAERQLIGWVICGLALGAATLIAGPITVVTVVMPIVILMLICQDRVGHLMGLLAAMFMGLLIVLPWIIYAHEHDSTSWQQWMLNLSAAPTSAMSVSAFGLAAGWRVLLVVLMVLPWPLWFIALAVQPFSTSSSGRRIRLILGSAWFVLTVAALIALPAGLRMGNLLPALPASAVALGQLFNHYADLAASGRFARFWRWIRWPHVLVLIACSLVVPIALFAEPPIGQFSHMTALLGDPHQWPAPAAVIVALLIPVGFSIRWTVTNFPAKAAIVWAMWTMLITGVVAFMLSRSELGHNVVRLDAERIAAIAGERPVYWYAPMPPTASTLLYAGRPLQTITEQQIGQAVDESQPFMLLLPDTLEPPNDQLRYDRQLPDLHMTLWNFDPNQS